MGHHGHLLAAISERMSDDVLFFGGTALSRTHAPDGRLSEDIDLIALRNRRTTAEELEATLLRATRREYPGLRWEPPHDRLVTGSEQVPPLASGGLPRRGAR